MIFNKIFFKLIWMCNRYWLGSESGIGNSGFWFGGHENFFQIMPIILVELKNQHYLCPE